MKWHRHDWTIGRQSGYPLCCILYFCGLWRYVSRSHILAVRLNADSTLGYQSWWVRVGRYILVGSERDDRGYIWCPWCRLRGQSGRWKFRGPV